MDLPVGSYWFCSSSLEKNNSKNPRHLCNCPTASFQVRWHYPCRARREHWTLSNRTIIPCNSTQRRLGWDWRRRAPWGTENRWPRSIVTTPSHWNTNETQRKNRTVQNNDWHPSVKHKTWLCTIVGLNLIHVRILARQADPVITQEYRQEYTYFYHMLLTYDIVCIFGTYWYRIRYVFLVWYNIVCTICIDIQYSISNIICPVQLYCKYDIVCSISYVRYSIRHPTPDER